MRAAFPLTSPFTPFLAWACNKIRLKFRLLYHHALTRRAQCSTLLIALQGEKRADIIVCVFVLGGGVLYLEPTGLVGGNPTMNTTPRLRRGGGIASSILLLLVLVLLYRIFCLSLSFWVGALCFLLGVFLPQPASCFSELVIFRNLLHIFSQVVGLSLFLFIYFSVPYFGLACDHGDSFLCLEE